MYDFEGADVQMSYKSVALNAQTEIQW